MKNHKDIAKSGLDLISKIAVRRRRGKCLLIDEFADIFSIGRSPALLFLPPGPKAGSMDCQMACEWRFETPWRAERVLSAAPFNTKRQLLCGDAWCCCCMAQEGRRASLTLNSTSGADCSHKVMKTGSRCRHSTTDNMYIVMRSLDGFVLMDSHK